MLYLVHSVTITRGNIQRTEKLRVVMNISRKFVKSEKYRKCSAVGDKGLRVADINGNEFSFVTVHFSYLDSIRTF